MDRDPSQTFVSAGLDPAEAASAARRYARRYAIAYWEAVTDLSGAAWEIGGGRPVWVGQAWRYAARWRRACGAYADTGAGAGDQAISRLADSDYDPLQALTGSGIERWRTAELNPGTEAVLAQVRLGTRGYAAACGIAVTSAHRRLREKEKHLLSGQLELDLVVDVED